MTLDTRAEMLAKYIVDHKSTIRGTASQFGLSKSTVHIDVSKKLKNINLPLYLEVKEILDNNFKERNVRGGEATKQKYLKLKNELSK